LRCVGSAPQLQVSALCASVRALRRGRTTGPSGSSCRSCKPRQREL